MPLTCRSCHYSTGVATEEGVRLWCWYHKAFCEAVCEAFVYAPGADEGES